jgi:O-succinylbenzoic acid--CoA ligase
MKIVAAHLRSYSLPLVTPVVTAKTVISLRRGWVLVLDDDAGNRGVGDAAPGPGFGAGHGATRQVLKGLVKESGPLAGAHVDDPESFLNSLHNVLSPAPEARAALELALLDLFAQRKGCSVASLLSDAPHTSIPICQLVSSPDEAIAAVSTGVQTLKLKVAAGSLDQDVARVALIRDAVGSTIALRLDANGGWTLQQAREALARLQAFEPSWVEQPLPAGAIESLQALRQSTEVPIAVDEGLATPQDLARHMDADALDVAVLKPMFLGGLLAARRMAEQALDAGLRVVVTTAMESAVGRLGALQLAASLPASSEAFGLGSPLAQDVAPVPRPRRGRWFLSGTPGLGVEMPQEGSPTDIPNPVASTGIARPDHPVLVTESGRWTGRALAQAVASRAAWLHRVGVRERDVVALLGPACPQWVITWHALGWLGACGAPLALGSTPTDLAHHMAAVEPDWAIGTTDEARARLVSCRPSDSVIALSDAEDDEVLPERDWPLEEPRALLTTSGTSGAPRAVVLNSAQWAFSAFGSAIRLGHHVDDVWLACLPLHHVGGLSILMRCALYGTTVQLESGFDATHIAQTLDEGRITLVSMVPTLLERVLDAREDTPFPSSLRAILVGGAPTPKALLERCKRLNVPIALTWGMTETASQVATTHPGEPVEAGCAGPPLAFARVHEGDEGLHVRGPIVGRPFPTHDRGRLDADGQIWIQGRRDDAITSGGETLDPAPIEAVLCDHPHIADAAVVGEPDSTWGQRPVAWLVRRSDAQAVSDDALTSWCAERLSPVSVPDRFHWVDALPRDVLGKLARNRLTASQPG